MLNLMFQEPPRHSVVDLPSPRPVMRFERRVSFASGPVVYMYFMLWPADPNVQILPRSCIPLCPQNTLRDTLGSTGSVEKQGNGIEAMFSCSFLNRVRKQAILSFASLTKPVSDASPMIEAFTLMDHGGHDGRVPLLGIGVRSVVMIDLSKR